MAEEEICIYAVYKAKLSITMNGVVMMKEKNKKTNDNEKNEELQQHALDMLDKIENIQTYETYDKNRIDTTNL